MNRDERHFNIVMFAAWIVIILSLYIDGVPPILSAVTLLWLGAFYVWLLRVIRSHNA